jgi:hypothetical protein
MRPNLSTRGQRINAHARTDRAAEPLEKLAAVAPYVEHPRCRRDPRAGLLDSPSLKDSI